MRVLYKAGLLLITLNVPILGWALGPCFPIAKACMQQGGYTDKQAMIKGCVLPVAQGQKTLPNANFTSSQLQQCKMEIMQKMQAKASGSM